MKKIVSLVLLVAMMMTSMVAIAESDITLPAGLEFGMSIDKAVAISGFEKSEGSYWWGAQIEEMGFSEKAYISGTATIGGYEAQVHCFFDDEGLKQVEYKITVNPDDETTAKAECDKIQASLSSKYGEPVERDKHSINTVLRVLSHTKTISMIIRELVLIRMRHGLFRWKMAEVSTLTSIISTNFWK